MMVIDGRSSGTPTATSSTTPAPLGAWAMNPPNEAEDSLYAVLGVPRDASRAEIDAAFLRFRYYDSSAFEGTKFTMDRIEYAHSILSDQLKRKLYDKFGEQTLRMVEHRYALAAADWLGLHIAALIATVVLFLLSVCLLIVVFLIALKIDGHITTSWGVVLVPLWLFWALLFSTIFGFGCLRNSRIDKAKPDTPPQVEETQNSMFEQSRALRIFDGSTIILFLAGYCCACILTPITLEGFIPKWSPLSAGCCAETMYAIRACLVIRPSYMRKEFARQGVTNIRNELIWIATFTQFVRGFHWFATWLLLALRMTDVISASYFIVFIPLFLSVLLWLLELFTITKIRDEHAPEYTTPDRGVFYLIRHGITRTIGSMLLVASLVLTALNADGVISATTLACMAPFLLYLFLTVLFALYFMYRAATLTVDAPMTDPDEEFAAVAHRSKSRHY